METWEQFVKRIRDPPLEPRPCTIIEVLVGGLPCFLCQNSNQSIHDQTKPCDGCSNFGSDEGRIRDARTSWRCPRCHKRGSDMHGGPCCNPLCKGMWGTGCYCCHHPRYLLDRFDPGYD